MASKRLARLNEQLKREIAALLHSGVRDPRVGTVMITGVKVAPDLATARVFVRVLGTDAEKAESLEGLDAAAPFLRRTIGQSLHVRRIPELRFQEDTSFERAQRIEAILHEVLPPGGSSSSGAEEEDEVVDQDDDGEAGDAGAEDEADAPESGA